MSGNAASDHRGYVWLCSPLVMVLLAYLLITSRATYKRLTRPWTQSPWEAEIVVDSWRFLHDKPVYTDPAIDHATHMYGPLATFASVPLVKAFGPDVRLPRMVSLTATLLLCVLAAAIFWRTDGRLAALLVFSLCYFQFSRQRAWETESRPDATSLLFSGIALFLLYRADISAKLGGALGWTLAGAAAIVVGMLFKQVAVAVALVSPLMVLLNRPKPVQPRLLIALIPLAAAVATLLLLRLAWPWVYFYVVTVPQQYRVNWGNWLLSLLELARFDTLFIASLFAWALLKLRDGQPDMIDRWLLVTIVVAGVTNCIARAKIGGSYNSLLLAYLAMNVFAARVIPLILRAAVERRWPFKEALLISLVIAALPVVDMAATARSLNPGALFLQHGDSNYATIIKIAAGLNGKFVCPDDPTIPLLAKGYIGRSGDCELDANLRHMPDFALNELRDAQWVLQIAAARAPSVTDEQLHDLGFEKAPNVIPGDSVYTLWKHN